MSSYILEHNGKKYFAIDNYFGEHQYGYIEKKYSDTWLSLNIDKSKILRSLPINEKLGVKKTNSKQRYIKQLKEKIKELEKQLDTEKQDNQSLAEDYKILNDFNNAGMGEMQFSNLQKEHYKQLLDEVEVLVDKGIKKHIIKQVIDNGKKRAVIDLSIHCDKLFF